MDSIWNRALPAIRERVGERHYKTWFKVVRFADLREGTLYLSVPNRFVKAWVEEHFHDVVAEEVSRSNGESLAISFSIDASFPGAAEEASPRSSEQKAAAAFRRAGSGTPLNPKYTFETFIVGASNQLAHAASLAVAELPGGQYNPLLIYGGVGLGKTHLLNAIGNHILQTRPQCRICYRSSEQFMNELINSIRYERMPEFRSKYRASCDILLIDDIQFLAGKERTQEEFFHTFNSLYESHRQIVLTSDRYPKEVSDLEERLRSRFEWGLIADIQAPDTETKIAILRKKADGANIPLTNEVALFLGQHIDSNIRKLEGALIRVGAFASLSGREISVDLAREVLEHSYVSPGQETTIESIQQLVAKHFDLKVSDLKSRKKLKQITLPRQVAMYLARKHTRASFPEIGIQFGGKDHSTVIHANKKIKRCLKEDNNLRNSLLILEKELKGTSDL